MYEQLLSASLDIGKRSPGNTNCVCEPRLGPMRTLAAPSNVLADFLIYALRCQALCLSKYARLVNSWGKTPDEKREFQRPLGSRRVSGVKIAIRVSLRRAGRSDRD